MSQNKAMPSIIVAGLHWDDASIKDLGAKAEEIRVGIEASKARLLAAGYECQFFFVTPEDGVELLSNALKAKHVDVVVIGYGVRGNPAHTPFLEKLVNAVHDVSPKTKIAFNVSPESTIDAIQRWCPNPE